MVKAAGASGAWLDRLARRCSGYANYAWNGNTYSIGGGCNNGYWAGSTALAVDTQTWNALSLVGSELQPQATFVQRKQRSLYRAAVDMVITEEWNGVTYSGTVFSPTGAGIQWENTGAAFLAFEWFLETISDGPAVTSQINCNANAEACAIATSRDTLKTSMLTIVKHRAQLLQTTGDEKYQGVSSSLRANGAPSGFGWVYFDFPHVASTGFVGMALEVALAGGDVHKYNPYSVFVQYSGAAAVWAALSSGQTQPVCPSGQTSQTDDISIVRGHMDTYLTYMNSKRGELIAFNEDPDFFSFITFIVPPSYVRHNLIETYDSSVMTIYFLGRADDEIANMPRAACYLKAAVDAARTLLRLMQAGGYKPGLETPQLRLGSFKGLFARYPAWVSGFPPGTPTPAYDAVGDLGNNACKPSFGYAITPMPISVSCVIYCVESPRSTYHFTVTPSAKCRLIIRVLHRERQLRMRHHFLT
ncbi:MAG: hypothetical protein SGPRY_010882 [Prymnesium sp.]